MGVVLKALVAGACCVVIAAGVSSLWSAHQRYEARNAYLHAAMTRAANRAECRAALETYRRFSNNQTNPKFRTASREADRCAAAGFLPVKYWLD